MSQDRILLVRDPQLGYPGPMVGRILDYLMEQVLDDPSQNSREQLEQLAHNYYSRHSENIINDKESDQ